MGGLRDASDTRPSTLHRQCVQLYPGPRLQATQYSSRRSARRLPERSAEDEESEGVYIFPVCGVAALCLSLARLCQLGGSALTDPAVLWVGSSRRRPFCLQTSSLRVLSTDLMYIVLCLSITAGCDGVHVHKRKA